MLNVRKGTQKERGEGLFSSTWTNHLTCGHQFSRRVKCEVWTFEPPKSSSTLPRHYGVVTGHSSQGCPMVRMGTQFITASKIQVLITYPPFSWHFQYNRNLWYLFHSSLWQNQDSYSISPHYGVRYGFYHLARSNCQGPDSQQVSLPPRQWAAGTRSARTAVGSWVQEKGKRRSSQSTISTKWDFSEEEGWSRCGWKHVLVYFSSSAKGRDLNPQTWCSQSLSPPFHHSPGYSSLPSHWSLGRKFSHTRGMQFCQPKEIIKASQTYGKN